MPDTTDPNDKSSCPVDSSTRSRWSSLFGARPSPPEMESCPVDSAARSKWLSQQSLSSLASQHSTPEKSCDSNTLLAGSISSSTPQTIVPRILNTAREVSTIPRGSSAGSNSEHGPLQSHPLSDISKSNNWIYPSEAMFFAAMKRKSYDPNAADMRTIVPIHNAVNERAWQEIKEWEMGRGSEKCGGPKLDSFSGDSTKLTPKARILTLLGYHPPFDRHDWTVDRCGKKIEYVIDFYTGKRDPSRPEAVNFYLDVRPKLQSFEGTKMRLEKWVGSWF